MLSTFQNNVIQDYDYTGSFVKSIKSAISSIGMSQGYFQKSDQGKHKANAKGIAIFLGIVGCLVMLIGNLVSYQTRLDLAFGAFFILGAGLNISAVCIRVLSRRHVLFTQFGADEYTKWRGLYNFLNSETLMKERTVSELALWECYLIYATAFGISEKVIKALQIRCPNIDRSVSPILWNPYFRTRYFYASSRSFRSVAHTASYSSRSGGWGGYGGGGRGGGGGGGGH